MDTIVLHGICSHKEYYSDEYSSLNNSHWLPWLQKQLLRHNIPDYERGCYEDTRRQEFPELRDELLLD